MRTVKGDDSIPDRGTFTQTARRAQLVGCAIDALVEVGYQQTTVAEVARRAGVSKGVVTYYFPARDDLIWAVVGAVFASVGEQVGTRLEDVPPGRFVATYLGAWVDYYRTYHREMIAIAEIWTSFRDANGRPHLDARTLGRERTLVEAALTAGQADALSAHATPSARPAWDIRPRAASAMDRHSSPTTGRSCPATDAWSARKGVASRAHSTGSVPRERRASRSAAMKHAQKTRRNHHRGSPSPSCGSTRRGIPNSDMSGMYGLTS